MHTNNPYTIIETKEIYTNPWLTVREDRVQRPEGKEGIFGVVAVNPGVSILPIDEEGNVYLIEEFQYAFNESTLLTITGGIDGEETPLEAAKRELREESGISATEWIDLGTIGSMTMIIDGPIHMFLARGLSYGAADIEDQQTIRLRKIPFSEAVDLVMENKIAPAVGNVLILKAKQYLS
jgi:8-oxo-dGTP pyrophosphatase MutT (NUDIX family)